MVAPVLRVEKTHEGSSILKLARSGFEKMREGSKSTVFGVEKTREGSKDSVSVSENQAKRHKF